MATYKANIRPGGKGPPMRVTIEANSNGDAQRLLEAQYGKGNVRDVFRA